MSSRIRNPFKVLGVSPSSSFETIQKRFNELALKYHPDSASASQSSSPSSSSSGADTSQFIRIRQAFEYIRKTRFSTNDGNSSSTLTTRRRRGSPEHHHHHHHHVNHRFSEHDFLKYFFEQTGVRLTSMQRREMIELYRKRAPGYYGGHSWDIARRLSFEQDSYLARMKESQDDMDGSNDGTDNTNFDDSDRNMSNSRSRKANESHNNENSSEMDGALSSNKLRRKRRR